MLSDSELKTWSVPKLQEWLNIYRERRKTEGIRSLRVGIQQLEAQLETRINSDPRERELYPFTEQSKLDFDREAGRFIKYLVRRHIPVEVTDMDCMDGDGLPTLQYTLTVDNRLACTLGYRRSIRDRPGLHLTLPNGVTRKAWKDRHYIPTPWAKDLIVNLIQIEDTEELMEQYPSWCR